jgi:hypothetical protein
MVNADDQLPLGSFSAFIQTLPHAGYRSQTG